MSTTRTAVWHIRRIDTGESVEEIAVDPAMTDSIWIG